MSSNPVTLSFDNLTHGNHRDISAHGIETIRASVNRFGAIEQHAWIVQQTDIDTYEIVEGNHRFEVWKENG